MQSVLYVSALTGSNSNTGTSESQALKTITKALSIADIPGTIYVMAGSYTAAGGEVFPLEKQSYRHGALESRRRLISFKINVGLKDEIFRRPDGP